MTAANDDRSQHSPESDRKKPRRHHYLPISFLERFCDKDGCLHAIDFKEGNTFRATPRNVANERDYYSAETIDDANDTCVETMFSDIEGKTKPIMDRMIDGDKIVKDSPDWDYLCNFIAALDQRGPHARFLRQYFSDKFAKEFAEMIFGTSDRHQKSVERYEKATGKKLDLSFEDSRELLDEGLISMQLHQNNHIEYMLKVAAHLVPHIARMTPHLWVARHHEFITGDCAIVKIDRRDHRPNPVRFAGWSDPWVQGAMPIGSHHCVLLDWDEHSCIHRVGERNVATINTMIAVWSRRFVYGASDRLLWRSPEGWIRRDPNGLIRKLANSKVKPELEIEGFEEHCRALINDAMSKGA